jgi:predicted nucleotidyltransferase
MVERLLEQIAQGLERRRVPYMIIGGQAVLIYGEPRLTGDVDVTLGVGPERLPEIQDLASASGWKILAERPPDFVQRTMVLPCLDPQSGVRLDFIFSFSPYEAQAIERARQVQIGETSVRFASPEDLVIHKMVAGRARDLEDVRGILLKNPTLDSQYVDRWLREFNQSLGKGFAAQFKSLRSST